jgi:hypothetical protein
VTAEGKPRLGKGFPGTGGEGTPPPNDEPAATSQVFDLLAVSFFETDTSSWSLSGAEHVSVREAPALAHNQGLARGS